MKKLLVVGFIGALSIIMTISSCSKDNNVLGANIEVTVKNWPGNKPDGITVYMYKNKEITENTKMADAKKQVVTDKNGVAFFQLNFTELNILESQTSLYFAVFYTIGDKNFVVGTTGVTVKRGESKKLELVIPL